MLIFVYLFADFLSSGLFVFVNLVLVWFSAAFAHLCDLLSSSTSASIYTVSGKKRPQFFLHNFNKYRHSFVIFGVNDPEDSFY